ncbi:hypothetical protein T11_15423, partial [Trichinella zimbabwensis]
MFMTIYARSSFNEGLSQQSQSVYTAATVKVGTKSSPAVSTILHLTRLLLR